MNKKQIMKGLLLSGIVILATFSSCKKDFLDINENPNAPADVTVVELLPSAELAIAHAVGNHLQIYGGLWGQFWTQSPSSSQYKTFENYSPSADDFDDLWAIIYSDCLKDLKTIITKATAEGKINYAACATILQAYAFQVATDNFGDIPFSQALQEEQGILTPKYDSQHEIYHGLINLVNSGLAMIDDNAIVFPGDEDLLFHGDMTLWRKFGNTLLLRIYMRMSEVDPGEAAAGVAALETSAAEFFAEGEEARIDYLSSGGNTNPLISSIVDLSNVQNLVASATAVDYMNNTNDPRVEVFYTPVSTGAFVGIAQGDYTVPAGTPVSLPGPITGGNGSTPALTAASSTAPVKLMTGYESLFLQAEAAERGWLTGNAQSLYEEAISESFNSYLAPFPLDSNNNPIALDSIYFQQDSVNYSLAPNKLRAIMTQKWIAMNGNQNDEAWIEWRRTGYPDFFTVSANSILGANRMPARFLYPSIEVTRNPNTPPQPQIDSRVWWDVN